MWNARETENLYVGISKKNYTTTATDGFMLQAYPSAI